MDQASTGVQKAMNQLSSTPNPVDSVHLSSDALAASEQHMQYSLSIKAEKVQNEIASIASSLTG